MGTRIFKTGIAVTIASAICLYFEIPVMFAALSAVVNMKPSIIQSWRNAWEQLVVHLVGIVVAFVIGLLFGTHPNALTMGLATVLVIWLCDRMRLGGSSLMGVLSALFILTAAPQDFVPHAIVRSQAIFVGLLIAPTINILILPPRYGQKLRDILQKLSHTVVADFAEAVTNYVELQPYPMEVHLQKQKDRQQMLAAAEDLLIRYREQTGRVKPQGKQPAVNPALLTDYLQYLSELGEKLESIQEVTNQRLARRAKAGNQPLSEEFSHVMCFVTRGAQTVQHLNEQLAAAIFVAGTERPAPTTQHYYEELAQVLESWHGKVSGSYYLHALVEVGVVISNIKWAADKARELFAEIQ